MRTLPLENNLISHAVYKRKHKTCIVTQLCSCSAFQMMHSISQSHTHTRFHKRLAVTLPVWYGTALWWKLSPTSLTGQFIVTQKCDWLTDRQTDLWKACKTCCKKEKEWQREEWERVGGRERDRNGDRNDLKLLIERTKQRQVEKKKKAQMSIVWVKLRYFFRNTPACVNYRSH